MSEFSQNIKSVRKKYHLSLSEFGKLVGVPASTIKRWEEGMEPRKSHEQQISFIVSLISNPDMVYAELARHGYKIDKGSWDSFTSLMKAIEDTAAAAADEKIVISGKVGSTVVIAVSGLLALIAKAYLPRMALGKIDRLTKIFSELL